MYKGTQIPKQLPPIIPSIDAWPINKFYENRESFIRELNLFVFAKIKNNGRSYEEILAKTVYLEMQRVTNMPWKVDPEDDKSYWKELSGEINAALSRSDKEEALEAILMRIINRYNQEIVGGFVPKVFSIARKFLYFLFKLLFNAFHEKGSGYFWGKNASLSQKLTAQGKVEELRSLFTKGTVVVVPTHFSNLDSLSVGFILDQIAGLPAFAYGAGLNLYDVELAAYYMNRLGAYRVDRRKKNPVYLECLTGMASFSLYNNLNNIFFPGGTRSRSGCIEDRLKLGLLGSAIEAQRMRLDNDKKEKIIIVPVVIGYNYVLEASSLIEQQLRLIGKEKYQRGGSEGSSSKIGLIKSIFAKRSEMYLSIGEPMDVMGNKLDAEGNSYDKSGKLIDLRDYFKLAGDFSEDAQREHIYTKLLGEKIVESYKRNNIVLASHLVAFLAFELYVNYRKDLPFFSIIKLHPREVKIPIFIFKTILIDALSILKEMEIAEELKLDQCLHGSPQDIIDTGLSLLGTYHNQKVLYINANTLHTQSVKLLYYYHNRLEGYELEKKIDWSKVKEFNFLDQIKENV